jgi:hypothetical protein
MGLGDLLGYLSFNVRLVFVLAILKVFVEPSYKKAMGQQKTAMGRMFIAMEYNRILLGMM